SCQQLEFHTILALSPNQPDPYQNIVSFLHYPSIEKTLDFPKKIEGFSFFFRPQFWPIFRLWRPFGVRARFFSFLASVCGDWIRHPLLAA
ncbi:MAG: hypothetical protein IKQ04_07900, partial [Oscillospiraceae bacterium]|nr:hypothetical protein [Oscillospiraceae bacterium]